MTERTNKIGVATGDLNRNRILKKNKQRWIRLKLISNSKNIDLNRVYIERFKIIGFSTYIKVNHNTDIKRSNVSEISTIDGTVLWKK